MVTIYVRIVLFWERCIHYFSSILNSLCYGSVPWRRTRPALMIALSWQRLCRWEQIFDSVDTCMQRILISDHFYSPISGIVIQNCKYTRKISLKGRNTVNFRITRRVLHYISHLGMCRPKGYYFWAFLVWKRVYTLPILVWKRVWFSRELREHMNSIWIGTIYANSKCIWRIILFAL